MFSGGGVIHGHPITKRRTFNEIRGKLEWNMTLILKMALLLMKIYFGHLITLMNESTNLNWRKIYYKYSSLMKNIF